MKHKIGMLKKINLRDVWSNEAYDFTTWLAENLGALSEALGIDLQEAEAEKKLENSLFHADIVTQTEDGEHVIIENQLEKTDHKHLGQILTYMIAMDSKIAVWVTKNPRPEHIKAINWLNEETEKDFYLVKVEAYSIDNSNPAPYFNIICEPSAEMKEVAKERKNQDLSERGKLRLKFWEELIERSKSKTKILSRKKPNSWTVIYKVINGITYAFYINKHTNAVSFLFPEERRATFLNVKEKLEKTLGYELEFETPSKEGSAYRHRLIKRFKNGGLKNKEKWEEIQDKMIDEMERLKNAIAPYLSEFEEVKEDLVSEEEVVREEGLVLKEDLVSEEENVREAHQERRDENREFFNQFLSDVKKEHPKMNLSNLSNNCVKAIPSEDFGHITIFRATDEPRIGVFWSARHESDDKLLELMEKESKLPIGFELNEEGFEIVKPFENIYNQATYNEQLAFLKEKLALAYKYMSGKIQKLESSEIKKTG